MMKRFLLGTALLAIPALASAHHGWSSYDATKVLTAKGALIDVKWGNPHGTARMRYQGKTWDIVLAPVARMEARGLTPAMVAPKQVVTLVGYPRLDGAKEMRIERVIVGDKTVELR